MAIKGLPESFLEGQFCCRTNIFVLEVVAYFCKAFGDKNMANVTRA
jgi:hypothetical protein